jgi:hypothetical protein
MFAAGLVKSIGRPATADDFKKLHVLPPAKIAELKMKRSIRQKLRYERNKSHA